MTQKTTDMNPNKTNEQPAAAADDWRIKAMREYIERNYCDEASLRELAAQVGMTVTALSRFIHQRTGRRFSDCVMDVRMRHIVQELTETDEPIRSISFNNGFNTLSNFNRQFLKRYGCTPSDYRQKLRD